MQDKLIKINSKNYRENPQRVLQNIFKYNRVRLQEDVCEAILPHLHSYEGTIYANKIEIFKKEFKVYTQSKVATSSMYNILKHCAVWIRTIYVYGEHNFTLPIEIATLSLPKLKHLVIRCNFIPTDYVMLLTACCSTLQTIEHNMDCSIMPFLIDTKLLYPKLWTVTTTKDKKECSRNLTLMTFPMIMQVDHVMSNAIRCNTHGKITRFSNGHVGSLIHINQAYIKALVTFRLILNSLDIPKDLKTLLWNITRRETKGTDWRYKVVYQLFLVCEQNNVTMYQHTKALDNLCVEAMDTQKTIAELNKEMKILKDKRVVAVDKLEKTTRAMEKFSVKRLKRGV